MNIKEPYYTPDILFVGRRMWRHLHACRVRRTMHANAMRGSRNDPSSRIRITVENLALRCKVMKILSQFNNATIYIAIVFQPRLIN